jgi:hypothetical protein
MKYFDVQNDQVEERASGYFDGTWSAVTHEIARRLGKSPEEVVRIPRYQRLGPAWRCPACNRSKIEIIRPIGNRQHLGFAWHHDHMTNDEDNHGAFRFSPETICEDCNILDGILKNQLREKFVRSSCSGTIFCKDFSFSPTEISSIFGSREPNSFAQVSHEHIDRAASIYASCMSLGLDHFRKLVRSQHANLVSQRRIPSANKAAFLDRWQVSEHVVDKMVEYFVDKPSDNERRELFSDTRKKIVVMKTSDVPLSDSEVVALSSQLKKWR